MITKLWRSLIVTGMAIGAVPVIAAPLGLNTPGMSSKPTAVLMDDSATVVLNSIPTMTWRSISPKHGDNVIIGSTRVNVRLATTTWMGKVGKIYMVLPAESMGAIKISWRSNGLLSEGQLSPGGRTLVYNGRISGPWLESVFDVQIEADGARLSSTQQLRFHFEIEVE